MEPQARVVFEQIKEELAQQRLGEATALLAQEHPADAADILKELEDDQSLAILSRLDKTTAADILGYLDTEEAANLFTQLDPEIAADALDETDADVAADILGEMEADDAAEVLQRMEEAQVVGSLLLHDEDSAAGVMTPEYVAVEAERTVDEVLSFLRQTKPESEQVYSIFVVDRERRLTGVVELRDLVVSQPETRLLNIMNPEVISVRAGVDQEEAARLMRHYDLLTMPVVDEGNRLIGTITFDAAADVLEEEATEDIYRSVGLSEDESVQSPFLATLRRRMPWLLINLLTAFLSASIVSMFEPTIARLSALAIFMPVVAGHGGNVGTQGVTLAIRGLALGEITTRDTGRVLAKELAFGALHGCVAGLVAAGIALILVGNPWLGAVVGVAMLGNVLMAVILGALLPMLLRSLGLDPALMSSIFLTTFTDIFGFLILLGLGTFFLARLLGG